MSRARAVPRLCSGRRMLVVLGVALAAALPLGALGVGAVSAASSGETFALGSWQLVEYLQPQPACTGVGYDKRLLRRQECGFGRVTLTPAAAKPVKVEFVDSTGSVVDTQSVASDDTGVAQFDVTPTQSWAP